MAEKATTKAVIFDMDGVLCDSEPLINEAAVEMFREKGLVVRPEDFVPFVGGGEDRYISGPVIGVRSRRTCHWGQISLIDNLAAPSNTGLTWQAAAHRDARGTLPPDSSR
jgi:beta-phosphoglucomutase-like phosphatase (HAD superfamily)